MALPLKVTADACGGQKLWPMSTAAKVGRGLLIAVSFSVLCSCFNNAHPCRKRVVVKLGAEARSHGRWSRPSVTLSSEAVDVDHGS